MDRRESGKRQVASSALLFPRLGSPYDATGPLAAGKTLACPVNANFLHTESFVDFVPAQNIFVTPTIPLRTRASLAPEKPVLPILDRIEPN